LTSQTLRCILIAKLSRCVVVGQLRKKPATETACIKVWPGVGAPTKGVVKAGDIVDGPRFRSIRESTPTREASNAVTR